MPGEMTLGRLLDEGRAKLEDSQVADGALDARLLLLEIFDLGFAAFLTKRELPFSGWTKERGERRRRSFYAPYPGIKRP